MKEGSLVSVKSISCIDPSSWHLPTKLYRKYIAEPSDCGDPNCSCHDYMIWSIDKDFYKNKFGLVVKSIAYQNDCGSEEELESDYSLVLFGDFKVLVPDSRLVERVA